MSGRVGRSPSNGTSSKPGSGLQFIGQAGVKETFDAYTEFRTVFLTIELIFYRINDIVVSAECPMGLLP
jgi:hypothetical protein